MADWAKIVLKTGLIAVVMVALWAVFTQIQIPALNFNDVFANFGTAMAIIAYWCPAFTVIWNTTLAMLALLVALWTFRFSMIAIRWLFKVNE
jgi:hypothetical protein